ncbi:hypothetical protein BKI52_33195 [marine bacterium AO1-C]|nr:hypothetical protein BKI52_33195 [marine bacterium AO1-C]
MKPLTIFLTLLICVPPLMAQSIQIKGQVIDAQTRAKIPFAAIATYRQDQLLGGTSADAKGRFQLQLPLGFTHLKVSFIGYQTMQITAIQIKPQSKLNIRLTPNTKTLDEVVVEGQRTTTQLKIDRKVIHLGSDVQQAGVNALEAFDQIAEVQTDMTTGTIGLRGSDNVQVLVNGKPSPLRATELLQQISAANIDRVEIITAPSAHHRSDGLSGIINIILKKNQQRGLNMGINATTGTRRYGLGLQGNYSLPSVNFKFNTSQTHLKTTNNQTIYRHFTNGNTESIFTPYEFSGTVYKLASGVDFFIQDVHELSFKVDYTDDSHQYFNRSDFTEVTNRNDYTYLRENEHFHYITNLNANYRLKLGQDNHFLEVDFNRNQSDNSYPIQDSEDNNRLFDQMLTEDFVLQSLALDYTLPMKKKGSIEVGAARNTQALESQNILHQENGASVYNQFTYDEVLWAGYGLTHFSWGKLAIQAGLRYEHFHSRSISLTNNFETTQQFSNWFPSLHLTYTITKENTVNLSYSKRVSRPNFHHVNAFQIVSPLYIWRYNPNITPEFSNNLELGYRYQGKALQASLTSFYRYRQNVILWIELAENNQQIFQYQNAGTFNSFGVESTLDYQPMPFWQTGLSLHHYFTQVNQQTPVTWDRTYATYFQFKNTWTVGKKISIDFTYLHTPKRQNTFNYILPRHRLDGAINVRLLKNKLSLNLRVVDIFNRNVFQRRSQTPNLEQDTRWNIQLQTFNFLVSMRYQLFRNKGKVRKRKQRRYQEAPVD